MRKLTPKTRSGLRSSANECDFREIRFYKTFLKADDDLRQRVIGRKPCLRRERQFGTRKRSRQEDYARHKVFTTTLECDLESLNGAQGFLNGTQGSIDDSSSVMKSYLFLKRLFWRNAL